MTRSTGHSSIRLADALADVVRNLEQIVGERLELIRAEAKDDLHRLVALLVVALLGPLLVGAALVFLALAIAILVRPWVPLGFSLLALASLLGVSGWAMHRRFIARYRQSLAEGPPPPAALPPAESDAAP